MNLYRFNLSNSFVLMAIVVQLSFDSAICADSPEMPAAAKHNVLLIGRPERGGVDIEKALENFPEIAHSDVYYLAPNSEGNRSIREYFPCEMPSDKPSRFKLVCLEQGMLNEVANALAKNPLEQDPEPSKFTAAHKKELAELTGQRKEKYEAWYLMKQRIKELEKNIIREALVEKFIREYRRSASFIVYDIIGLHVSFNTQSEDVNFCEPIELVKLFDNKEKILVENEKAFEHIGPLEEEVRQLARDLDIKRKEISDLDSLIDPLNKLEYSESELRKPQQSPSSSLQKRIDESREQRLNKIRQFIASAWDLVDPNGQMIVFSRDAFIEETELAQGISKTFLESLLKDFTIEEQHFCSQSHEGELYISNPIIPAIQDTFGWTGPRRAGSYFLIRKLK